MASIITIEQVKELAKVCRGGERIIDWSDENILEMIDWKPTKELWVAFFARFDDFRVNRTPY